MTLIDPGCGALSRAIQVLGGESELLRVLKIKPGRERLERGHVYYWRKKAEVVPAEYCPDIEAETNARGDPVLCEHLNPKVDWAYVRGQPIVRANS